MLQHTGELSELSKPFHDFDVKQSKFRFYQSEAKKNVDIKSWVVSFACGSRWLTSSAAVHQCCKQLNVARNNEKLKASEQRVHSSYHKCIFSRCDLSLFAFVFSLRRSESSRVALRLFHFQSHFSRRRSSCCSSIDKRLDSRLIENCSNQFLLFLHFRHSLAQKNSKNFASLHKNPITNWTFDNSWVMVWPHIN